MIQDHRPDTLTPKLREIRTWEEAVPRLLEAAKSGDAHLPQLVRQAMRDVQYYALPLAWTDRRQWVIAVHRKLESPNKNAGHWMLQNSERAKWQAEFKKCIPAALGVADWRYLESLGRLPQCRERMVLQIVRLVGSSRQFIRDLDNFNACRKRATDALKRSGLLHDDSMKRLDAKSTYQDVSPDGRPYTVFFLWPADADLF